MCGRFTLRTPMNRLLEHFQVQTDLQLPLRFNVAPTQPIAAVRQEAEGPGRELVLLRWGLVPSWSKSPTQGARMINARAESVAERPAFRAAFKRRRCLVAADGYYEWQKVGQRKQPYYIHFRDERPFAFAGLWERWQGAGEGVLESCTIITTDANPLTREIHDRMPVILDPADYALWLDPQVQDRQQLEPLLESYDGDAMVAEPVSTHVNNVRNDDPECIQVQRERF